MLRIPIRRVWLALLLVLLPAAAFSQSVSSLPQPTDYVSDFAHVLSPQVTQELDAVCSQVDHQAHAQIAVVTVNTLDGAAIQDYVVDLYQKWGLGAKSGQNQDRGVLIFVAVQDRKRSIRTGYGLEGILPDSLVGRIGRDMVPSLRNNDFDGAMLLAVGQISQIIGADAGVKISPLNGQPPLAQPIQQPQSQPVHIGLGGLIFFGIAILFILFLIGRFGGSGLIWFLIGMFFGGGGRGGRGGFGGGGGGGGDGFGGFGGGSTGGGGADGSW